MEDARWKEHPCFRNRIEFPSCSFQEKCGRREGGLPTNLTLARLVTVCYGRENKSETSSKRVDYKFASFYRAAFWTGAISTDTDYTVYPFHYLAVWRPNGCTFSPPPPPYRLQSSQLIVRHKARQSHRREIESIDAPFQIFKPRGALGANCNNAIAVIKKRGKEKAGEFGPPLPPSVEARGNKIVSF